MGQRAQVRAPAGRQPCPGHVAVLRIDVPPSVEWQCTSCGDEGVISAWEHSPFDLRGYTTDFARPGDDVELVIDDQVAATLRSLTLIDSTGERLVFRARPSEHGIVLRGNEDDVDELIGYVAAEANREPDRGVRNRSTQPMRCSMTRSIEFSTRSSETPT